MLMEKEMIVEVDSQNMMAEFTDNDEQEDYGEGDYGDEESDFNKFDTSLKVDKN